MPKPLLTFCTACMGYTKYLKQTYLENLRLASDPKYSFVLVNYNSQDDMDLWVKETLNEYILQEKLLYFHTKEPSYWHMAKAKNVSHSLGTGDYLCNLDADNYLTTNFLSWVDSLIRSGKDFITQGLGVGYGGRVVVKRSDFEKVGGYDETRKPGFGPKDEFNGFSGRDHNDLCEKVALLGVEVINVSALDCVWIEQTSEEKLANIPPQTYTKKSCEL